MFSMTVKNTATSGLLKAVQAMPLRAAQGLNVEAEETATDAKEHTPVRYGILKRSGKVSQHASPRKLEAKITFGTAYAIFVHEMTHLRHRVGEAKFLEHALQRRARVFASNMASYLKGH